MKKKRIFSLLFTLIMCVFLSNATILPTYAYSETTLAKIKALDLSKENDINQYIKYKDEIHDRYYKLKSSGKFEEAREVLDEIKQIDNYTKATKVSNQKASLENTRSTSNSVNVTWISQVVDNKCGVATAAMILSNHGQSVSINDSTLLQRLKFNLYNETVWYTIDGMTLDQYPMATTLNTYIGSTSYIPKPYKGIGSTLTASNLWSSTVSAVDAGRVFACDGISYSSGNSHLTNYPATEVHHWLVISGYKTENGSNYIHVTDPAAGISGFTNVSAKRYELQAKMYSYASSRGIIY